MKNIVYRPFDDRFMGRKMINGQVITVYAKTLKECQQNLRMALKNLKLGLPNKKETTTTFKSWWDKWFKEEKEPYLKARSIPDITTSFDKLKPLHNLSISKITKDVILKTFAEIPENRGKEKAFLYLKACFNSALKHKIIKDNPFDIIKTPPRKHKHKPPFTYLEQVKILENLKELPLYPVIIVYLCTGMRKNEFDFKNIEKHIDFENYVLKAENLKGRTKEKRYKNILISKGLCDFIMDNLETIHSYDAETAYREFSLFLKKLKITGSIVTCRHTYATNNFYLGNPELFISRNMGHQSSQITKDNYTDIDYQLSKEKVLKLYNNLVRTF